MPIYDRGNLNTLNWTQRIDIEFIEGDKNYSPKVSLKIGKADMDSKGWKIYKNKHNEIECPQEMRTANLDTLRQIHINLWKAEAMLRKENFMPIETYKSAQYDYMQEVTKVLRR
jgi:hypothetical protein